MLWRSVDKCLFLSVISLLFSVVYWLMCYFMLQSDLLLSPFNPEVIKSGLMVLPIVAVGWLLLTLYSFQLRRTESDASLLVYITVLYYCIPNAFLCYLLGPVTSPLVGIAAIGSMIVSFMLLDFKPALASVIALLITLVGLTVAERFQLVPYAPLMEMEYPINGRPSTLWITLWGTASLLLTVILVGLFAYLVIRWRQRELLLEKLSYTDALTGITNRRKFLETLELEIERAKRTGTTVSLLMCDADHFKRINDNYGHKVGDLVLKEITQVLEKCSRYSTDLPARIGGEEFAIMLAETNFDQAIVVADRVVQSMRNTPVNIGSDSVSVTLSLGIATQSGKDLNLDKLIETADLQLYRAKSEGRDRVCYEEQSKQPTERQTRAEAVQPITSQ